MEIKNLDSTSLEFLNSIVKGMQTVNPVIKSRIFVEGEELKASDSSRLNIVEQKLDKLINKIDLIFGDAIQYGKETIVSNGERITKRWWNCWLMHQWGDWCGCDNQVRICTICKYEQKIHEYWLIKGLIWLILFGSVMTLFSLNK